MHELLALLIVLCVAGFATVAAVVAVAVLLARRVARAVGGRAERLELQVRSRGVGLNAEVARSRAALRSEVEGARSAVQVAVAHGWPVGDAPGLVARLQRAAAEIDAQLRQVTAEPRPDLARGAYAQVAPIARAVADAASSLRCGLRGSARDLQAAEIHALVTDTVIESRALRTS